MATLGKNSVVGTKAISCLHLNPIEGYHLSGLEWEVLVFIESKTKTYTVKKEDCLKQDDDNYLIPVDSSVLGAGEYWGTVTLKIPDGNLPDGIRIERRTGFMDIIIDPR